MLDVIVVVFLVAGLVVLAVRWKGFIPHDHGHNCEDKEDNAR